MQGDRVEKGHSLLAAQSKNGIFEHGMIAHPLLAILLHIYIPEQLLRTCCHSMTIDRHLVEVIQKSRDAK